MDYVSSYFKSGYTKQKNVCPQARKFYVEALKLQKKTNRMKKSNVQLKNRLKLPKSLANRKDFEQFSDKLNDTTIQFSDKLNDTTIQFFKSQVKCQRRKLKGRRYNISDKILALPLYKTSPKGYRFLSTIFSLPSRKTLSTLLNKVPFHPGINVHIIENLKHQVNRLKKIDKSCVLLFDEMALEPGLTYDRTNDIIFGFEKNEDLTMTYFSDHVLVFMLRGIKKKWKQPIAYYFCNGTTKTDHLVMYIKQVISSLLTTGLQIIATVCDQGATNVAAIRRLKEETNRYCLSQNIENQYLGFLIEDVEVVPVFDPPHLLKCIRNNMLTKNVQFTYRGESHTASWKDVETLYKFDKKNCFWQFYLNIHSLTCPKLGAFFQFRR